MRSDHHTSTMLFSNLVIFSLAVKELHKCSHHGLSPAFLRVSPSLSDACNRESLQPIKMTSCSREGSSSASGGKLNRVRRKKGALYSFEEARKIARGHGFETKEEFMEYDCPGAYQVPKNPDDVWKDEWRGWDDFLGIMLSFEEGREVARDITGIRTMEDYIALLNSNQINDNDLASRLPVRPDLYYKSQWIGWDDWLLA